MKKSNYLLIIIGVITFFGCKKEYRTAEKSLKTNKKPVRVISLEQSRSIDPITASGVLVSNEEAILSFKIGGVVQSLNVSAGETVNKNQRLANLNLSEINAQVESAKYTYEKSIRDFDRATNLYRDTVGTLEQVQNMETLSEIAKSNLTTARFNRQFAIISSPYRGNILKKYVEVGEIVSPGQPIYKIGTSGFDGSQVVRIGLADKDVIKIKLSDTASVAFDAVPNELIKGIVTEIAGSANATTGLYNVELTLEGFLEDLKNGFIGKVELYPGTDSKKYKIPIDALVEGNGTIGKVFISENGLTAIEKEVEVSYFGKDYMVVDTENLPLNASVVIEGAAYIRSNDSIQIVR